MPDYRYGSYPRAQRIALLVLLTAVVAVTVLSARLPINEPGDEIRTAAGRIRAEQARMEAENYRPPPETFAFDPNVVTEAELLRLGLSEKQAASWLKFRGGRTNAFRQAEDIGKLFILSDEEKARLIALAFVAEQEQKGARPQVQGFVFDPNTVSAQDLQRLGLSAKQSSAFIRYRDKSKYGRTFRKPEDILRLKTLSDEQKAHLVAYAAIPPEEEKPAIKQRFPFDPNTISADSLSLLGFPAWQAKSFVKYRGDRTNTFRKPEDLRRVGALDSALVEEVIALVNIAPPTYSAPAAAPLAYSAKPEAPAPASFNVNAGNLSAWQSLPGIGEYRASRIIRYRNQFGGFYSLDQLRATPDLPDSVFQQILPYLTVGPVFRKVAINRASFEDLKRHPYINRNLANVIVKNREKFGPFANVEDLNRIRLITDKNRPTIVPYLSFE